MKHMIIALTMLIWGSGNAHAAPDMRWAAYYGDKKPWEEFLGYDVVVFDADHHPDVRPLVGRDTKVLAYLSLVEVHPSRPFFYKLKQRNLLMDAPKGGAAVVDIRKPEWMALLIEEVIPVYVRQGFIGLMFDTVDTATALEAKDPVRYAGMRDAAVSTIRHIRAHYPYLQLMVNRGFEVLPRIEGEIDMILAESIFIDSRDAKARPFPESHTNSVLQMLADTKARRPDLQLYSLDYWDMEDAKGVKKIYSRQRKAGFAPYVATPDLQSLFAEP